MTFTKQIFEPSTLYKAKASFQSGPSQFSKDELLRFRNGSYSPYDSSFVYVFQAVATGEDKYWLLHRDADADVWSEYFEVC
jgi:hypothetical protein